jgi:hypothetical protein
MSNDHDEHLKVIYRIDGKLDMLLEQHNKHNERILSLELIKERAIAYVVVIGSVVTLALNFIPHAIASVLGKH